MSKKLKENYVKELFQRYESINHCFIVNYRGMSANNINNFRAYLRENKIKMNVLKNSLVKTTLAKMAPSFKQLDSLIEGPIALIYSTEVDGVSTAKRLVSWVSKNKSPEIKTGYIEGNIFVVTDIKKLSQLPSREILLARLATAFQSPTSRLVRGLSGIMSRLGRALNQYALSRNNLDSVETTQKEKKS